MLPGDLLIDLREPGSQLGVLGLDHRELRSAHHGRIEVCDGGAEVGDDLRCLGDAIVAQNSPDHVRPLGPLRAAPRDVDVGGRWGLASECANRQKKAL